MAAPTVETEFLSRALRSNQQGPKVEWYWAGAGDLRLHSSPRQVGLDRDLRLSPPPWYQAREPEAEPPAQQGLMRDLRLCPTPSGA